MDFTGLTTEEMMEKWKREFVKILEQKKEQKRKEREEWEIFRNENPNVYNDYMIEEEDLQLGKYIFIF
jgi:hypothetical protein